jgi:hypothetical protein
MPLHSRRVSLRYRRGGRPGSIVSRPRRSHEQASNTTQPCSWSRQAVARGPLLSGHRAVVCIKAAALRSGCKHGLSCKLLFAFDWQAPALPASHRASEPCLALPSSCCHRATSSLALPSSCSSHLQVLLFARAAEDLASPVIQLACIEGRCWSPWRSESGARDATSSGRAPL